jgi:hypothetical protein
MVNALKYETTSYIAITRGGGRGFELVGEDAYAHKHTHIHTYLHQAAKHYWLQKYKN